MRLIKELIPDRESILPGSDEESGNFADGGGFAVKSRLLASRDPFDGPNAWKSGLTLSKVRDHQRSDEKFIGLVESRLAELEAQPGMKQDFLREMQRFPPAATLRNTLENPGYWTYLKQVLGDQAALAINALK